MLITKRLKDYKARSKRKSKIMRVNDMFADRHTYTLSAVFLYTPSELRRWLSDVEKEVISDVWSTLTRTKIFSIPCTVTVT